MVYSVIILCGILTALYFFSVKSFKYWRKRGVKYDEPLPIFGSYIDVMLRKKSEIQLLEHLYKKYPEEKVVGFFKSSTPNLLIRDPDDIQRILTTDFHYFYSRNFYEPDYDYQNVEPLRRHLIYLEGDIWRLLRLSLTPAFTNSKLKAMFPLIVERAERLQQRARALAGQTVDARDLMARYTIDFIGACGLGIDADTLNNDDSYFGHLGRRIFNVTFKKALGEFLKTCFPYLFKTVKLHAHIEKEFICLINEIMKERNYKPSERHDFIDLMLEIKTKGTMECDSMEKMKPDGTPQRISMAMNDKLIAAQAFAFFAAGFETSASSTSYTLHEMAYNPEKQKKVQADIDQVLAKHENKLSYDAIKEMNYLDWSFKEGLRMFPPVGVLARTCRKRYTFPELGLVVDEGTRVSAVVQAIHRDPKYWDSPEEFRPERFSPESNEPRHKYAYLPFGGGPRICIGERLGLMESLAGLAAILSQFDVAPAPTSVRRPVVDPKSSISQRITGGLPLVFTPRK